MDGLARRVLGFMGRSSKNPLAVLGVICEGIEGVPLAEVGGAVEAFDAFGIGGTGLPLGGAWKLLLLGGGAGI